MCVCALRRVSEVGVYGESDAMRNPFQIHAKKKKTDMMFKLIKKRREEVIEEENRSEGDGDIAVLQHRLHRH